MNKVILLGRLTRDPEVRYSNGARPMAVARYTLAVNRRTRNQDGADTDFINVVAFDRTAEFTEKYLRRGMPILISGRIQTGSYTDRDGRRVNTFEVIAEEHEFVESRSAAAGNTNIAPTGSGFMDIPQNPGLPFN